MKKRKDEPWMAAPDYGRSIRAGLGVNLLVRDTDESVAFARSVLAAKVVYHDPDIAVLSAQGSEWMVHADHTYGDHPLSGLVTGLEGRGAGAELRLYGRDPDAAQSAALDNEYTVLAGAMDKPHGLREAYLVDPDGYVWVPSVATASTT